MKTIKLIAIVIVLFLSSTTKGQVSVNINVGSPPQWGPVGYTDVRYYYLPDVEAYYDIESSMFIYYGGGAWVHRAYLPSHFSHYDLYSGYKVVITDYRGREPYIHFTKHKTKYKKGYKGKPQKTIGTKPGKGNSKSPSSSKGQASKKSNTNESKSSGNKSAGNNQNKTSSDNNKSSGKDKGQKGGGKKK